MKAFPLKPFKNYKFVFSHHSISLDSLETKSYLSIKINIIEYFAHRPVCVCKIERNKSAKKKGKGESVYEKNDNLQTKC